MKRQVWYADGYEVTSHEVDEKDYRVFEYRHSGEKQSEALIKLAHLMKRTWRPVYLDPMAAHRYCVKHAGERLKSLERDVERARARVERAEAAMAKAAQFPKLTRNPDTVSMVTANPTDPEPKYVIGVDPAVES